MNKQDALTKATMSAINNAMNKSSKLKPADKTIDYKEKLKLLAEDYANDCMNLLLGFITEEDLYNLLNGKDTTEEIIFLEQK